MLFVYSLGHSQVGIVTNNPDKNSILDLTGFNNKGLNLPKVALTSKSSPSPLTAHVAGMMVYNTATAGTGSAAVSPGVYVNDGVMWSPALSAQENTKMNVIGGLVFPDGWIRTTSGPAATAMYYTYTLKAGMYRILPSQQGGLYAGIEEVGVVTVWGPRTRSGNWSLSEDDRGGFVIDVASDVKVNGWLGDRSNRQLSTLGGSLWRHAALEILSLY